MKYTGDGYGNLIEGDYRRNFERTTLCSKMLQNISDQITTFRPSESLHNLRSMVMDEGEEAEAADLRYVVVLKCTACVVRVMICVDEQKT